MTDIVELLRDLHQQATTERSHYYVASCVDQAIHEIERLRSALAAERESCAAFAYAKHDWPPRWIAAALRGESSAYTDFCETALAKDRSR